MSLKKKAIASPRRPSADESGSHGETETGTESLAAEQHLVFLSSAGFFLHKTTRAVEGGRLTTLWNYPLRKRLWRFASVAFHPHTHSFALADERGQVFTCSLRPPLRYESVRLASTRVSAICFVASEKHDLLIAYENATIVVLDCRTKEIKGNIHLPHVFRAAALTNGQKSASGKGQTVRERPYAKILRSHPKRDLILAVTDDDIAFLWDLRTSQCTQTLECNERIVDVRFEMQGVLIAICLEKSGVFFYHTDNLQLVARLDPPSDKHGRRVWTSYVSLSHRTRSTSSDDVEENTNTENDVSMNILLASNENKLYSWFVGGNAANPRSHCFGFFQMPGKDHFPVSLAAQEDVSLSSSRVCVLFSSGALLLLESQLFQPRSAGFLTVCADLPPSLAQSDRERETQRLHEHALAHAHSAVQRESERLGAGRGGEIVVVGEDGAARVFREKDMRGSGVLCGKVLKVSQHDTTADTHTEIDTLKKKGRSHKTERDSPQSEREKENRARPRTSHNTTTQRPLSATENNSTRSLKANDRSSIDKNSGHFYEFFIGSDEEGGEEGKRRESGGVRNSKTTAKNKPLAVRTTTNARLSSATATARDRSVKASPPQRSSSSSRTHSFVSAAATAAAAKRDRVLQSNTASLSLFDLAHLTPKEKRVNEMKLRAFLQRHGEYPARYRPLIWRFLLHLPENAEAFADLVKRGVHPAYEDLQSRYPIESRKLFHKLQSLCSQVAHWAPVMSEASYLPSLCFPFILIYNGDDLAALETVLTILLYWGHSWHALHPNPPAHIVSCLSQLVKLHEPRLYQFLIRNEVDAGLVCWQMLRSLFTEIASRSTWCALLDLLFSYFKQTALFVLLPVAILRDLKALLMNCDDKDKILCALSSQQNLRVDAIRQSVCECVKSTPRKYFAGVLSQKELSHSNSLSLSHDSVEEENMPEAQNTPSSLTEREEARVNLSLSQGTPVFPIPQGSNFPVYHGYPHTLFDLQIKERNRVLLLQNEVKRKNTILRELELKIEALESEQSVFLSTQTQQNALLRRQREDSMNAEKEYLRELMRIEEEIASQRLRSLELCESAQREEMTVLSQNLTDSHKFVEENEKHARERMEMMLSLQRQREVSEKAELTVSEKMREMRVRRGRDEWIKSVSNLIQHREDELSLQDKLLYSQWQREDEERQRERETRTRALQSQLEVDALQSLQQDVEQRMRKLQVEREARLLEVERLRATRLAQEQASEALESAERSALMLKKQQLLAGMQVGGGKTANSAEFFDKGAKNLLRPTTHLEEFATVEDSSTLTQAQRELAAQRRHFQETLAQVQRESERLREAERVFHARQLSAQRTASERVAERETLQSLQQAMRETVVAEEGLQASLQALQSLSAAQQMQAAQTAKDKYAQRNTYTGTHVPETGYNNNDAPKREGEKKSVTIEESPPSWSRQSKRIIPTDDKPLQTSTAKTQSKAKVRTGESALLGEEDDESAIFVDAELMPFGDAMHRASKMLLDEKDDYLSTGPLDDTPDSPLIKSSAIPPTWMLQQTALSARNRSLETERSPSKLLSTQRSRSWQEPVVRRQSSRDVSVEDVDEELEYEISPSLRSRTLSLLRPQSQSKPRAKSSPAETDLTLDSDSALWAFEHDD